MAHKLTSVTVCKRKSNSLRAKKYSTAETHGINTEDITYTFPSISNDGTGPNSDGRVGAEIWVKDPNNTAFGPVKLWVQEKVDDVIALDD